MPFMVALVLFWEYVSGGGGYEGEPACTAEAMMSHNAVLTRIEAAIAWAVPSPSGGYQHNTIQR